MAYDDRGNQKRPIFGLDLADSLPEDGAELKALAKFFHNSEAELNTLWALLGSDGTYSRQAVDDLISVLATKAGGDLGDIITRADLKVSQITTSAAAHTFSNGTTDNYVVLAVARTNETDAFEVDVGVTIGGTTYDLGHIPVFSATQCTAGDYLSVSGGGYQKVLPVPFILGPNDEIVVTDTLFTAADTVKTNVIYLQVAP